MSELKTKRNSGDVQAFLNGVEDEKKRADCLVIARMMSEATGHPAELWGEAIVGFGQYHYCYKSGREGDWFLVGFSPRKQNITLYIMSGFAEFEGLMARLGKYTTGKACLYIKRLADVDLDVLRELVRLSAAYVAATH